MDLGVYITALAGRFVGETKRRVSIRTWEAAYAAGEREERVLERVDLLEREVEGRRKMMMRRVREGALFAAWQSLVPIAWRWVG